MPSKKSTQSAVASSQATQQGGGGVRPASPVMLAEGMDPVLFLLGVIDKKTRNLEKRKQRLTALEEGLTKGKALDKDQKEAVTKLPDVLVQLDLARDFQKQFQNVQAEYLKLQKKKQKQEKMQQKESEQEAVKSTVSYILRVQYLLFAMDDKSRENFTNGTGGAEQISEAELMQLDEFYTLINPTREGDPRYLERIDQASEHLVLLYDQSTKPVVNTTYAALHDLIKRVDECGYFDKPLQQTDSAEPEDDDEDSDLAENELPEPLAETAPSPVATGYDVYGDEGRGVLPLPETEESDVLLTSDQPRSVQFPLSESPVVQQLANPMQEEFLEHAPAASDPVDGFPGKVAPPPEFVGLQGGPDLGCVDGFSFMRDTTVPEVAPPEDSLATAPPSDHYTTCGVPSLAVSSSSQQHHQQHLQEQPAAAIEPMPLLDEVAVNGQTQPAHVNQNYSHERQGPGGGGGYHGKRNYVPQRGGSAYTGPRNNSNNGRRIHSGGGMGPGGRREGGGGSRYKPLPQRGSGRPNYRQYQQVRSKQ